MGQAFISLMMAFSVGLVIFIILDAMFGQQAVEDKQLKQRLGELLSVKRESILKTTNQKSIRTLNQLFTRSKFINYLDEMLKLLPWTISIGAFVLISVLTTLIAIALLYLIYGSLDFAMICGIPCSLLPFLALLVIRRRYIENFSTNFADALGMMKNAVKSGQGVQSALRIVAQEGPYPVNVEFQRVIQEIEVGSRLNEALHSLHQRIPTIDFRLFMLGVVIQMEVGGSLSGLFENIAKTIRDRISLRREVNALTSQAKTSAVILISIPFVTFFGVSAAHKGYFDLMFNDPTGRQMLMLAAVLISMGSGLVMKLTQGVTISR